jgi:hypothetical protein
MTPTVAANVMVPLPDGTRLATLIVRPDAEPATAVLLRTPYGKDRHLEEGLGWAKHGFAFVAQDVRGRYESDGVWQPYRDEQADGAAVVDWLAAQPWVKDIVVTGGSYAGFAAWAAAASKHTAIRAAIVLVPAMGSHHTMFDPAGILNLADHTWWWMTYADGRTERPRLFEAMHYLQPAIFAHLPVAAISDHLWADLPGWRERLLEGSDPEPSYAITDATLTELALPALHIGGWHDPFVRHTMHQWSIVGSAVSPRPEQTLIVGPWTHTLNFNASTTIGERDFGSASRLPLGRVQIQWLRRVLIGGQPTESETPVRIFVMGENTWRYEQTWPQIKSSHWYTTADYSLQAVRPTKDGAHTFVSDPETPFPSRSLPVDQRDLLGRTDAVWYRSAPLPAPLSWIGSPTVHLVAATDGPGTDWVVRLHEEQADGRLIYLCHGLVDAARASPKSLCVPGEFVSHTIPLNPQAITLPAGSRVRLEVASSAFPEHARNLQTGANRYTTSATRSAHQQIGYGPQFPTGITFPTIAQEHPDG